MRQAAKKQKKAIACTERTLVLVVCSNQTRSHQEGKNEQWPSHGIVLVGIGDGGEVSAQEDLEAEEAVPAGILEQEGWNLRELQRSEESIVEFGAGWSYDWLWTSCGSCDWCGWCRGGG